MSNNKQVYGIDLGTTYSCIAKIDQFEQPVVLKNFEGDLTTPSAVYFEDEKNVVVGIEAKGMLASEPENTVVFIKRQIGVDAAYDKTNNMFPYGLDPTEISAYILKKLVNDANDLGDSPEPIKDVVITCPAYFGTKERMQTKQAGEIAGLNVLAIINEPTAAAIAYGMKTQGEKTVLVYDLGGGTFDVTIIAVNGGEIRVIATGGDHHLGGVDWDTAIAEYMLAAFNHQTGESYTFDDYPELKYTLLLEAESKKKLLTARQSVKANIQFEGLSARVEISRDLFNSETRPLLDETIKLTKKTLEIAAKKGYGKIDEFLLVGGSSKMPQVMERFTQEFGANVRLSDPNECVAKGAAIYAMNEAYRKAVIDYSAGDGARPASLSSPRSTVINVTSKTYGIGIKDARVRNYIFANTPLPIEVRHNLETSSENQKNIWLPVFESDFTDEENDRIVPDKFCVAIDEKNTLRLSKDWPIGTPIEVIFRIDEEGILSINASVEHDSIDFSLKIAGVKSDDEVRMARDNMATIR